MPENVPPAQPILRSVSDTAILVAYHRAIESRRADALFHDEIAERLSAARGALIARTLRHGRRMAWTTIVRTVVFDDIVTRMVAGGVDTVVNLAAGLDARPYRLRLPSSLRWIEIDLPEIVREKNQALAAEHPACALERIAADLADAPARHSVLAQIGARAHNALVLSEGLLMYLTADTVAGLAEDLRAHPAFRRWATDLATPIIQKRVQRWWGRNLKRANAHYQFAPAGGTRFFEPHGWREAEFHVLFDAALRLNRTMSGIWIYHVMKRVAPRYTARQMAKWRAGVALLERVPAPR